LWIVISTPYNHDIAAFQRPKANCRREFHMPASAATSPQMNVLIADSNRMQAQLLTGALRRRPEFQISGCQMNSASILESVALQCPRVALLCFSASGDLAQEFATLRGFHFSHPEIHKILLVEACSRDFVVQAFRSGARGIFTITDCNLRVLCKCILRVAAGQIWASSEQLNYLVELISEIPSLRVLNSRGNSLLTPREEQVVALVAEGLGNRQIATELHLSEHTIKKYLFHIFEKLGVSTRVELVLYAFNNGDPRPAEWLAGDSRDVPSA
jgi:DNA-binding NarL/FixJ family response regulator